MLRLLFCFAVCVIQFSSGLSLCGNGTLQTRNCSHIFDQNGAGYDTCTVQQYQPNSEACKVMNFGDLNPNTQIGGVSLRPYILQPIDKHGTNYTVLNITFSNIKWKTMKFRFQLKKTKDAENSENHCSNIVLSNDKAISDQFVLYYDCYWSQTERNYNGRSHILDFVATDDVVVNRGQYYFNMPSLEMLSPSVKETEWKPFVYMEILTRTLKLHILPPRNGLKILGYRILVKRECERIDPMIPCIEVVKNETVSKKGNMTDEVLFEYNYMGSSGVYYFAVSPLYHDCVLYGGCQIVETPRIRISNEMHAPLNICIASVTALVVASLFAYYIVLRVVRRYWCKDGDIYEIPSPPKILVIYPSANRLHAECVASFITYLRSEYGFDIMYDGDISATSHGDPQIWAEEAFKLASHILYIVGPAEETNYYNNIYDKPLPNICALKNIDRLLLTMIKTAKALTCHKDIANVFFEHSNKTYVPMEITHEKKYYLLKDWQKLIADLSKNLLPKRQIMRTERGKSFLEDLTRAKKLLGNRNDDVIVKCEMNAFEKKVLL